MRVFHWIIYSKGLVYTSGFRGYAARHPEYRVNQLFHSRVLERHTTAGKMPGHAGGGVPGLVLGVMGRVMAQI